MISTSGRYPDLESCNNNPSKSHMPQSRNQMSFTHMKVYWLWVHCLVELIRVEWNDRWDANPRKISEVVYMLPMVAAEHIHSGQGSSGLVYCTHLQKLRGSILSEILSRPGKCSWELMQQLENLSSSNNNNEQKTIGSLQTQKQLSKFKSVYVGHASMW